MITMSDKLSMRKQESLLVKLLNKEVDHHPDTGLVALLKKRKKEKLQKYGTQLNQEKFLMIMSRLLLKSLLPNILLKPRELLLPSSLMIMTLEKHLMRKPESPLEE
jgi:hypothetical protein